MSWARTVWGKTIWGDRTIEPPLTAIQKVVVPIWYAVFIYLGIAAQVYGVPTLSEAFAKYQFDFFFGFPFVYAYGFWQWLLAGIALLGYILHNRLNLESVGLSLLLGQWSFYIVGLIGLAIYSPLDTPFRGYGFGLALLGLLFLLARLFTLKKEIEKAAITTELVRRAIRDAA